MKDITWKFIAFALSQDDTVTREQLYAIKRVCLPDKEQLLTAKQAMERLGVSRVTLRAYAREGKVEQVNLSKEKVRFTADSINKLLSGAWSK